MSEFTAIRAVSLSLKALLEDYITNHGDPQLAVPIDLRSPKEMREDNDAMGISFWLYRVARDGLTLNRPPKRIAPDQLRPQPLPLDLFYLVTPISQHPEDEQALLGRVLQVLNDHAVLRGSALQDSLAGGTEELRLTLNALSLEEVTRVWDALKEPYQLSVCYRVQVVTIDSDHEPIQIAPVLIKETTYAEILDSS